MTHNEAIDFLKTYDCVCPYGKSPTDCRDNCCEFYRAVNSLAYTENMENNE